MYAAFCFAHCHHLRKHKEARSPNYSVGVYLAFTIEFCLRPFAINENTIFYVSDPSINYDFLITFKYATAHLKIKLQILSYFILNYRFNQESQPHRNKCLFLVNNK